MPVHPFRVRRLYSTPSTTPTVVRLSDLLQDVVLEQFVNDREMSPSDVVAAMTWSLALFVVATEDDSVSVDDQESAVLLSALDGLRRSVETVRRVNRDRGRVQ